MVFLFRVVNLVTIFKVPRNNIFLFWHYWIFCTRMKTPTSYDVGETILCFPEYRTGVSRSRAHRRPYRTGVFGRKPPVRPDQAPVRSRWPHLWDLIRVPSAYAAPSGTHDDDSGVLDSDETYEQYYGVRDPMLDALRHIMNR